MMPTFPSPSRDGRRSPSATSGCSRGSWNTKPQASTEPRRHSGCRPLIRAPLADLVVLDMVERMHLERSVRRLNHDAARCVASRLPLPSRGKLRQKRPLTTQR